MNHVKIQQFCNYHILDLSVERIHEILVRIPTETSTIIIAVFPGFSESSHKNSRLVL
jgi:hypothetical protein